MKSEMQILRFYLVGQDLQLYNCIWQSGNRLIYKTCYFKMDQEEFFDEDGTYYDIVDGRTPNCTQMVIVDIRY